MINFVKHKTTFMKIGCVTIAVSMAAILTLGLRPGIDFSGGTIIEVKSAALREADFKPVTEALFREFSIELHSVQQLNDDGVMVKAKPITQEKWTAVKTKWQEAYPDLTEASFETIGPLLGQELLQKTLSAVVIAAISLLIYIAWRFRNRMFGVTAVVALIHDILLMLGAFAIFGYFLNVEIDIMFVTAALTALAFSMHDTIVVYDRVRETLRRNPKNNFAEVVNMAINATMVRSLSTSSALVFVLTALLFLGGENIRWFVVALLIGVVTGVYSSPFIASPLLVFWQERKDKKK